MRLWRDVGEAMTVAFGERRIRDYARPIWTCHFRGGPIDGQTLDIPYLSPSVTVPVWNVEVEPEWPSLGGPIDKLNRYYAAGYTRYGLADAQFDGVWA